MAARWEAAAAAGLLALAAYASLVDPVPAASMAGAAVGFGVLGALVAARRLYFLAGAAPHAALLAALLGVPLLYMGLPPSVSVPLLATLLVYAAGFPVYRGADPDRVTSVFVAATASASVVAGYLVLTRYPLEVELQALVFGDPVLATPGEAAAALAAAAAALALGVLTYRENVYIGVSREHALLAGLRVWVYDLAFFTLLGLATSLLLRVSGFVLEHVFILLPGSIAASSGSSGRGLWAALGSALLAAAAGLWAGLLLGLSPSGVAGLSLLGLYLASLVLRRGGGW